MSDEPHQGKNVSLEEAAAACEEAAKGADEREEIAVDWNEVVEVPAGKLTLDSFKDRVGQRFEIELGQHDAQVEVAEVTSLGEAPDLGEGAPQKPPFSVVFRGHSARAALPEGWYRMRHEELGEFEICLSPLTRDFPEAPHTTPHLEAVFN